MRNVLSAVSGIGSTLVVLAALAGGGAPAHAQDAAPMRGASTDAPIKGDTNGPATPPPAAPAEVPAAQQAQAAAEPRVAIEDQLDLTALRRMAVQDNGRRKPFDTFARERVKYLLGTDAYRPEGSLWGEDPVYTFLSLLFETERWLPIRALKIQNQKLIELFRDQRASMPEYAKLDEASRAAALGKYYARRGPNYISLEDVQGEKFRARMAAIQGGGPGAAMAGLGANPNDGAAIDLSNRFFEIANLRESIRVAPEPGGDEGEGTWAGLDLAKFKPADRDAVQGTFQRAGDAFRDGRGADCSAALNELVSKVEALQGAAAPAGWVRSMEVAMNRTRPFHLAWMMLVIGGLLLAGAVATGARRSRITGTVFLVLGLLLATFGLAGRTIITERAPVANIYEAITFAIFACVFIGTIFELFYRNAFFGTAASLFGFLGFLLVDLAPNLDPNIGPIRPVLVSYWLNIHVTSMLTSYGTFAVAWGLAVLYFAKYLNARGLPKYAIAMPLLVALSGTGILFFRAYAHQMPKITDYALALVGTPLFGVALTIAWLKLDGAPESKIAYEDGLYLQSVEKHFYRVCQVGFLIITTGIILGAVWANESWGRYWGWDPKETWAFITWLIYGAYIHGRIAGIFKGPTAAIWGIVGFNAVLFTLFGVSFVLPGLHSYLK